MNKVKLLALASISVPFVAGQAFAAGYEKSIMWGGRTAGVAGIATPYIQGSQALYFNPAGLVRETVGQDVSLNVSPTWSQFSGPINNDNQVVDSKQSFSTPFGLIYGATLNENWGFGVGGYISGGAQAVYENVEFGAAEPGQVDTDLVIGEVSAGVGYRVNENWKLGAAYRFSFASADFSLVNRSTGGALVNARFTDLEDQNELGFRLGAQYKASENTLIGLSYRSEVKFEAEGNGTYTLLQTGNPAPGTTAGPVTASTVFPQQVTLGAQHSYETWRSYAEYAWTNYSAVDSITLTGAPVAEVQQDWADQHNIRLAGEYLATAWPVRFGYGWTSQVTNEDFPRATFAPPGMGHTVTAGTGQTWEVMGNPVQFDIAGEYTWVRGDGGTAAAGVGDPGADFRQGTYTATSYSLHTGLTVAF